MFLPPTPYWLKLHYLIDLSSLLTVISFSVRNILFLRTLAVGAQLCAIPYFLLQSTPLWAPIGWTSLFILINLYQIWLLLLERRPIVFTADEQKLYNLAFQSLTPREFIQLLKLGQWQSGTVGERIMTKGESTGHISVISSGKVLASSDGTRLGEVKPGQLVGTSCALIGEPCYADAEFVEESHYINWPIAELSQFLDKNPKVRVKFADIVNRDLADKVNTLVEKVNV